MPETRTLAYATDAVGCAIDRCNRHTLLLDVTAGSFAQLRSRFELVERLGVRAYLLLCPAWSDLPINVRLPALGYERG